MIQHEHKVHTKGEKLLPNISLGNMSTIRLTHHLQETCHGPHSSGNHSLQELPSPHLKHQRFPISFMLGKLATSGSTYDGESPSLSDSPSFFSQHDIDEATLHEMTEKTGIVWEDDVILCIPVILIHYPTTTMLIFPASSYIVAS